MHWLPLLLAALHMSSATLNFSLTDCSNSPNKILHFEHVHLFPHPIHVPGQELVALDLMILQPISGNHYTLDIVVKKHVLFSYINIPCGPFGSMDIGFLGFLGTCSYDLCDLLNGKNFNTTHHCPIVMDYSSIDFPCACPFQPGTYHLNPTAFTMPAMNGTWQSTFNLGDFHVMATITDTNTGETVACYKLQASVEADCMGIACLFGK